jgi:hypothetical protein
VGNGKDRAGGGELNGCIMHQVHTSNNELSYHYWFLI